MSDQISVEGLESLSRDELLVLVQTQAEEIRLLQEEIRRLQKEIEELRARSKPVILTRTVSDTGARISRETTSPEKILEELHRRGILQKWLKTGSP